MTLMSFLGTPSINITVTSEAVRGLAVTTPVEMALVMDTTGSMGSTYMNQAKVAARQLLTTIYDGDKTTKKKPKHSPVVGAFRRRGQAEQVSFRF